MKFSEFKFNTG